MPQEINPNNPTTRRMQDNPDMYAKLLALVLQKYRDVLPTDVVITMSDIAQISNRHRGGVGTIVVDDRSDGLHVSVVDAERAKAIARRAGGLPT
jgi:hypothetical protein